jgi:hypothetical protein
VYVVKTTTYKLSGLGQLPILIRLPGRGIRCGTEPKLTVTGSQVDQGPFLEKMSKIDDDFSIFCLFKRILKISVNRNGRTSRPLETLRVRNEYFAKPRTGLFVGNTERNTARDDADCSAYPHRALQEGSFQGGTKFSTKFSYLKRDVFF